MAELLNQKEIDQLLTDALSGGQEGSEEILDTDLPTKEQRVSHKKYKGEPEPFPTYSLPYKSPVLKKEKISLDPIDELKAERSGRNVVWSLKKYTDIFGQKKRSSEMFAPFETENN
ncbi:hypothetical protein ACFL4T_13985 [candidate division KSB1 bacterium]